jgi:general nucleoside transport system permease protein
MSVSILVPLLVSVVTAATPLLLAALGELVVERAGVLNLGVEGMMLVGAVAAFAGESLSGSAFLGVLAGAAAGVAMAGLFAVLTLVLTSNQVATGLALTIFGIGLSALAGSPFVGHPVPPLPKLALPGLSTLPIAGPLLFGHDALVYLSVAATAAVALFLGRSRAGLVLRAVGEADESAHALGYGVLRVRALAVLFGGAMAGLGGAYLSLAYTPMWVEQMTAGRGWIALALVVFAAWRPWRLLVGAYLFGGIAILQLYLQGSGLVVVPSQVLAMLPYLATILVLTLISSGSRRARLGAPACLGKPFRAAS